MPEFSAGHHNDSLSQEVIQSWQPEQTASYWQRWEAWLIAIIQQPLNDAQMLAAWLLSIKGAHNASNKAP